MEYRTFRVSTLYEGVNDALAAAPQQVDSAVLLRSAFETSAGRAAGWDGTIPGGLVTELPPAFQGLDVAFTRFYPGDPYLIVSAVFTLNFGEAGAETLHALPGLQHAEVMQYGPPISPVFFGLAKRIPTTSAGPDQNAVDQLFADLAGDEADAVWAF